MRNIEVMNSVLKMTHMKMFSSDRKEDMYRAYRDARCWLRFEYKVGRISDDVREYFIKKLKSYKKLALKNYY